MMEKIPRPRCCRNYRRICSDSLSLTTDTASRLIPKMYSKMSANQELRKLCGVGAAGVGADKVRNSCLTSRPPRRSASRSRRLCLHWPTR